MLLKTERGYNLNYFTLRHTGRKKSNLGIIFFSGLGSDINGTKVSFLKDFCQQRKIDFTCFDYLGHGESDKPKEDNPCTIELWKKDCFDILNNLTSDRQIVIGSSLGGWLGILTALAFPERVASMILLAPAPDFTVHLMSSISDQDKRDFQDKGFFNLSVADINLKIDKHFLQEAENNFILNRNIDLQCPIRIMHSLQDDVVSYQSAVQILEKTTSLNTKLSLDNFSDHRLSKLHNLVDLQRFIEELLVFN